MGLIEIYHVVADQIEVDPDFATDTVEGMVVGLTTSGTKTVAAPSSTGGTTNAYGLAGDTQSNTQAGTPYAADLVIGANGPVTNPVARTRSTGNRVSDLFDETLASGLITVYTGGGKFATDQYDTTASYTVGAAVQVSATAGIVTSGGGGATLGVIVEAPKAYPSGVPGTDTTDGSLSLGNYLTFKLTV